MLVAIFMPVMALAETPPAIPLAVYGDIKVDSANAPIGTIITVFNGASEIARITTTQAGKYFLEVPAGNAGASLAYKVNGTLAAEKIAVNPLTTPSDKIDLSITAPAVSAPAPASSGSPGSSGGGGGTYTPPASPDLTASPDTNQTTPTVPLTPLTPTIIPQVLGVKIGAAEILINKILGEASSVIKRNWGVIKRDAVKEKNAEKKYLGLLFKGLKTGALDQAQTSGLNEFIVYGTETTKILGEGERAGVLGSYKSAFGKLPKSEPEWQDALKIASGRWPSELNPAAETKAKASFKKIYGREANMKNQNDNAAVTVMAYGLRPSARNLNSEKAAILAFKHFIKRAPASAVDWDIVRAIAYSGAKR